MLLNMICFPLKDPELWITHEPKYYAIVLLLFPSPEKKEFSQLSDYNTSSYISHI